jgi:hypothetical protein
LTESLPPIQARAVAHIMARQPRTPADEPSGAASATDDEPSDAASATDDEQAEPDPPTEDTPGDPE